MPAIPTNMIMIITSRATTKYMRRLLFCFSRLRASQPAIISWISTLWCMDESGGLWGRLSVSSVHKGVTQATQKTSLEKRVFWRSGDVCTARDSGNKLFETMCTSHRGFRQTLRASGGHAREMQKTGHGPWAAHLFSRERLAHPQRAPSLATPSASCDPLCVRPLEASRCLDWSIEL